MEYDENAYQGGNDICMYACMHACTYVCMNECTHTHTHTHTHTVCVGYRENALQGGNERRGASARRGLEQQGVAPAVLGFRV